ncbi:MAG TPA: acetyl-CoA carboxylase biotin carboxyl carrier protein subunit [Candidatus Sulfopaludibacter sp.]|nr:acetyl-CoA carboxylase biotin carboxyl carrier protein subunit [Candidatus Sulfopaludibacter sp.]
MKIKVNDKEFDIEIFGNKAIINDNLEKKIEIKDDKLIIDNKEFYLDYYEEKEEESLLIINGMAFVVSKKTIDERIIKEIKSPMNGNVNDILVKVNSTIEKGQGLVVLEAMKMFNEIKSPINGEIKNILVQKNQTVKSGETMIILK